MAGNCNVNVEMKRWQLLANRENKSPLTQVAAESMMRNLVLEKERNNKKSQVLYSVLTDCTVLYCVCHEVSSKKYWISRSMSTPEEILLSICWLYLCSIGKVKMNVSTLLKRWKEDEVEDDEPMEEGRSSTRLGTLGESDDVNDECNETHGHSSVPGGRSEECEMALPVVPFEDDIDEQGEREHWQTMFLMDNHRKYGTPLPLTEAILSLHDIREDEGGGRCEVLQQNIISTHFAQLKN